MAYSKAKLKSSGDRGSPCFRPFWIGKLSDKCLPIRTLQNVSCKHVLNFCYMARKMARGKNVYLGV
jgi:hypothetical protein